MMKLAKLAPLAALLLTAVAAPASFADTHGDQIKMAFHFDRSASAEATYASLQKEARKACAFAEPSRHLDRIERDCASRLIDKAVAQIGDVRLAQLNGTPLRQMMASANASGR